MTDSPTPVTAGTSAVVQTVAASTTAVGHAVEAEVKQVEGQTVAGYSKYNAEVKSLVQAAEAEAHKTTVKVLLGVAILVTIAVIFLVKAFA
jgi:hypothetical protein